MSRYHQSIAACICIALWLPGLSLADEDLQLRIDRVTEQIRQNPDDHVLYVKRAELHREHGEYAAALADFAAAAESGPSDYAATLDFLRGRLWVEAGKPDLALRPLDRFILSRPRHVGARLIRARAHEALENFEAAIWDYTVAIRLEERPSPEIYLDRARILASDKVRRTAESLSGIDAAIENLGPLVSLLQFAVELEAHEGNYVAAIQRVDMLPSHLCRQPRWLVRRAELLQLADRQKEARLTFSQALAALEQLPHGRRLAAANVELMSEVNRSLQLLSAVESPGR